MLGNAKDATFELMDSVMTTFETHISKATWQLKQVTKHTKQKVLVVLDSEYENGSWINQTGEIPVSKLIRIRFNCCLWSKPDGYSGRGRPTKAMGPRAEPGV